MDQFLRHTGTIAVVKHEYFAAFALLALIGCQSPAPEPKPFVASKAPEAAVQPKSVTPGVKRDENVRRVYQLSELKKVEVKLSGKPLILWLMNTDGKREEGMMWLKL